MKGIAPKNIPLEITAGQQVGFDMTLGHLNIWSYSGSERRTMEREQGFTIKAQKAVNDQKAVPASKGYWNFKGTHANFLDCANYVGILKAFEHCNRIGKTTHGTFGQTDVDTIVISATELCAWCNKEESNASFKALLESMCVLESFVGHRYEENEKGVPIAQRSFRLLRNVTLDSKNGRMGKVRISIDSEQCKYAVDHALKLSWRTLQDLSGQVAKGLYLWITSNSCTKLIPQNQLLTFLGVIPPAKPKDGSRQAKFDECERLMGDYQKTRKDIVYKIKKELTALSQQGLIGPFTNDNINTYHGVVMYSIQKVAYAEMKAIGTDVAKAKVKAQIKAKKAIASSDKAARDLERDLERLIPMDLPIQTNLVEFDESEIPY